SSRGQRLAVSFDQLFELIFERISQLDDVFEVYHFLKGIGARQLGAFDDHIVGRPSRVDRSGQESDGQLAELRQLAAGKGEVEGFEQLFEAGLSSNHNMQDQIVQEEFLHLLAIAIASRKQLLQPPR